MTTTLAEIRQRVRRITGRLTTASLKDDMADQQINLYYRHHLPRLLAPEALQTWFTFQTTDGVSAYGVDERVRAVFPPVFIDGEQAFFTQDQGFFLKRYPDLEEQPRARPESILFFNRTYYLAPIPDGAYTVRVHALYIPEKMVGDTAAPVDPKWGETIALGAAMLILYEDGDFEQAQALDSMLGYQLKLIRHDDVFNWHGMRSVPQF